MSDASLGWELPEKILKSSKDGIFSSSRSIWYRNSLSHLFTGRQSEPNYSTAKDDKCLVLYYQYWLLLWC